jgi:hypothetical protein
MRTKAMRHRALLARRSRRGQPEDTGIGAARGGYEYARLISSPATTHARVAPAGTGHPSQVTTVAGQAATDLMRDRDQSAVPSYPRQRCTIIGKITPAWRAAAQTCGDERTRQRR